MRPVDQGHLYVFMHLPKTGGTTINGHLHDHMEWDTEVVHLGAWGKRFREREGRLPLEKRPAEERSRVRVITGHGAYFGIHQLVEGSRPRYLTVLRDPADRIVSTFNFRAAQGGADDFWSWYDGFPRNAGLKWLRKRLNGPQTMGEVIEALRGFWFVGVTEHLDDDLPGLFRVLGLPTAWRNRRVAGAEGDLAGLDHPDEGRRVARRMVVDEDLRARLHRDNPRDVRLYRFAQRRREQVRNRLQ